MAHSRRFLLALTLTGTTLLASSLAGASWPTARHDGKRQGLATGTADLATPAPYWRTYLGGALSSSQLLNADVDGDGKLDFILATGGQIVAKRFDDSLFWRTDPRGVTNLVGIADLDGDGKLDVVARSSDRILIFALATGAEEWAEPGGEMGTVGGARIGDVTGDGKPDLVVVECMCCSITSGNPGFIWSFGKGFSAAAHTGTVSQNVCGSAGSVTLVQADSTPALEILLADANHFVLLDGEGKTLAESAVVGTRAADSTCLPANIDGKPGDEIVCLLNSVNAPATNQRRISVLRYDEATKTLAVLWTKTLAPDAGGDLRWQDPVADFDGDGKLEIAVSAFDTSGWSTKVLDALDGTVLASASGEIVAGVAHLDSKDALTLLTTNSGKLTASSFKRTPSSSFTTKWSLTGQTPFAYPAPALLATTGVVNRLVATDLDGDGFDEFITWSTAGICACQPATSEKPRTVPAVRRWS